MSRHVHILQTVRAQTEVSKNNCANRSDKPYAIIQKHCLPFSPSTVFFIQFVKFCFHSRASLKNATIVSTPPVYRIETKYQPFCNENVKNRFTFSTSKNWAWTMQSGTSNNILILQTIIMDSVKYQTRLLQLWPFPYNYGHL